MSVKYNLPGFEQCYFAIKKIMKQVVLFLSIVMASGLMLVNMYTSLVDAKSWGSDIPNSISTAREYFKVVNPGNFFRIFSPVNQVLALAALIVFWKFNPSVRWYLGIALILYVLCDVLTFGYFYPRNDIMFRTGSLSDIDLLKKTLNEWTSMNWVSTLMLLVGIVLSYYALNKSYLTKPQILKTQTKEQKATLIS